MAALCAACASHSAPAPEHAARASQGDTCSSAVGPAVTAATSQRLAKASNVLEYENIWKAEHPGATSGTISGSEVRSRIHSNAEQLRSCYESALGGSSEGGRVVVRFVIDPAGQVAAAHVADSFGAPELDCCVVKRLAQWRFPKPSAGAFVAVEYPFVVHIKRGR